jgi:hypothetical protein
MAIAGKAVFMLRVLPRLVAVTLLMLVAVPAAAQEQLASTALHAQLNPLPNALSEGLLFPTAGSGNSADIDFPANAPDFSRLRRPSLLPALYATNIVLQALDAHSTVTALDRGAREANPLMTGVVEHRGALLAVKVGAAAGTIYFAEKLWRRNRVAAIAVMAAVNGVSAVIVAHNYRVAARQR